jgi:N-acetylglutamate synthase-like GNAT family acetyltransferase
METARISGADTVLEHRRGDFLISTDRTRLDLDLIHRFLTKCYWAQGISRDIVARSIDHSLCFGIYDAEGAQVAFARVISDFATYAYIGDVFVLESQRRRGLGKWLMQCIMEHPRLQGLRRWGLVTMDAHGLYAQSGFTPLAKPQLHMEIYRPQIYENLS